PVVNTIVAKLNEDRIRSKSPGIELAEGERKTVLYRETIQRIQEKLKQLGLFHAEIDGMFNDATRSAVIAFQTDIGFETTGFPDQATLWRL
ncbi:MAG: peptidoglycan-binding protein, partial [Gammaproteobacteria bacterium]|nr:peptidoglycan-binding protein [Gammaproteobacteria bacterium]